MPYLWRKTDMGSATIRSRRADVLTYEDDQFLRRIDGLLVGLLTEAEQEALQRLIEAGAARYSYEGGAGLMGLAKARRT